jgi:hypothetical protein
MIDAYMAAPNGGGVVVPRSSMVTGYDSAQDATGDDGTPLARNRDRCADHSRHCLAAGLVTATDLPTCLRQPPRRDLPRRALQRHNALPPLTPSTSLVTTDLLASTQDFTNSIVFSRMPLGYNLVDSDAIPGDAVRLGTGVRAEKGHP